MHSFLCGWEQPGITSSQAKRQKERNCKGRDGSLRSRTNADYRLNVAAMTPPENCNSGQLKNMQRCTTLIVFSGNHHRAGKRTPQLQNTKIRLLIHSHFLINLVSTNVAFPLRRGGGTHAAVGETGTERGDRKTAGRRTRLKTCPLKLCLLVIVM